MVYKPADDEHGLCRQVVFMDSLSLCNVQFSLALVVIGTKAMLSISQKKSYV